MSGGRGSSSPSARAEDLRRRIRQADHEYYVLAAPTLTDAEYDRLYRELVDLEAAHPELATPDSPTRRVGGLPASEFASVEHLAPMLSLDSLLERSQVEEFDQRVRKLLGLGDDDPPVAYACEPKIDGVAIELVYRDGALATASTRGDGAVGEDVTANARTIRAVPLRLLETGGPAPAVLSVRGEVYLGKAEFLRMNEERAAADESTFANPRNAAAGALRQLDASITATRPLAFYAYAVADLEGQPWERQSEVLAALAAWGLPVSPEVAVREGLVGVAEFHEGLRARRDALAHEIDGIVAKVDDLAAQRRLGFRSRSPRWAVAWKFEPVEEITRLEDVIFSVGRTGTLNPVAVLAPVEVAGVTVRRASLFNRSELARKDLRIGDQVIVHRAGDVIPYVVRALTEKRTGDEKEVVLPDACPSCGTPAVEDGVFLRCPNGLACPAQLVQALQHYGGKHAMDIDQLGERIVQQLVDRRLVTSLDGLYALDAETVAGIERMGAKSAAKLIAAIEGSKRRDLARLLFGLGIRNVGEHVAGLLARRFRSLDALAAATEEELETVKGVGPEVARAVRAFFAAEGNRAVLARLAERGVEPVPPPEEPAEGEGPLAGRAFVFTGTLVRWTREQAGEAVQSLGARVVGSVSKKTTDVVAGSEAGSKLDKARALGLRILSEDELDALLAEHGVSPPASDAG